MKHSILITVLMLSTFILFSQKNNSKIETYYEQCCATPDSLSRKFSLQHFFYVYKPKIDSCGAFIEKDGKQIKLPVREMKIANYFAVGLSDSLKCDSCIVSIVSLKHKNRSVSFRLNPKYFFVRAGLLERGWIVEYTNKIMTIL